MSGRKGNSGGPAFSVVIPVLNNWAFTEKCLRGLAENTPEYEYEVIVADNASSDATVTDLVPLGEALFGRRFQRLRFEENRNFGPACNAGARAAKAPLLFFLNNDTLPTSGWAPPLIQALEQDAGLGAVGPLLLYPDDTVQHLGVAFSHVSVGHLYQRFPRAHPVVGKTRVLQALTAAALLLPKEPFLELGGFYEGFRNGFEDVDLCLRLVRAGGKKLSCIPRSVIYHFESRTPGRKRHETENSRLLRDRCFRLFTPDKHRHGSRDGFLPFINDFLEIGLRLREEDEEALAKQTREASWPEVFTLVTRHPLWVGGRQRIAAALDREGQFEQSLVFYTQVAGILGSSDSCRVLLQAAARAGNEEVLSEAKELFKSACAKPTLLQRLLREVHAYNDKLLEQLHAEKLLELRACFTPQPAPPAG